MSRTTWHNIHSMEVPDTGSLKAITRMFNECDLPAIRKLICDTIDHSYSDAYPASAISFFKEYHQECNILDDSRKGLTLVVEIDGHIVATGTLLSNEIKRMFVSPNMQGMGLGRAIMDVLLKRAKEKGLERVFLDSSIVSNGFYSKMKFQTLSESYIPLDDGNHLDYTRMFLVLKGER